MNHQVKYNHFEEQLSKLWSEAYKAMVDLLQCASPTIKTINLHLNNDIVGISIDDSNHLAFILQDGELTVPEEYPDEVMFDAYEQLYNYIYPNKEIENTSAK